MVQKYTEPAVRKIVEEDTNHEYSLIDMDHVKKKDKENGKKKKREMTIKHNEPTAQPNPSNHPPSPLFNDIQSAFLVKFFI